MAVGTTTASPGLQSTIDTNSSPVIPSQSMFGKPEIWSWIWFIIAIAGVAGFHIRVFGAAIPPAPRFP